MCVHWARDKVQLTRHCIVYLYTFEHQWLLNESYMSIGHRGENQFIVAHSPIATGKSRKFNIIFFYFLRRHSLAQTEQNENKIDVELITISITCSWTMKLKLQ